MTVFGASAAHADNEFYQLHARTCSPYVQGGCAEVAYVGPQAQAGGLGVGGAYSWAGGYHGGYGGASATFAPGAPMLLQAGRYENSVVTDMQYTFQVKGAPDTLVPLHALGFVSILPIHLSDQLGHPATLVDGLIATAPTPNFSVVASAGLYITPTRGTPYPDSGAGAYVESRYQPRGYDYDLPYCTGCSGTGQQIDKTFYVWSNSDIRVDLGGSVQLIYNALGGGLDADPTFATVAASADPIFSIDDPAYSGFSIVGVPTGSPPPGSAVPEPASWATMVGGLGLLGGLMRRRATPRVASVA
jgi:hypothetical protein